MATGAEIKLALSTTTAAPDEHRRNQPRPPRPSRRRRSRRYVYTPSIDSSDHSLTPYKDTPEQIEEGMRSPPSHAVAVWPSPLTRTQSTRHGRRTARLCISAFQRLYLIGPVWLSSSLTALSLARKYISFFLSLDYRSQQHLTHLSLPQLRRRRPRAAPTRYPHRCCAEPSAAFAGAVFRQGQGLVAGWGP